MYILYLYNNICIFQTTVILNIKSTDDRSVKFAAEK